jgi:hypothetical protein
MYLLNKAEGDCAGVLVLRHPSSKSRGKVEGSRTHLIFP